MRFFVKLIGLYGPFRVLKSIDGAFALQGDGPGNLTSCAQ